MKKKLLIILAMVIIIGGSFGIYYYFKNRNKPKTTPTVVEGKIMETVMPAAKISPDKNWVYYYSSEDAPAFYRTEIASKKTERLSDNLSDVEEINYSLDFTKVGFQVTYNQDRFEKYGSPFLEPKMDDGQKRFWIYDFKNKKLNYLNQGIISYVFSADNNKIFYLFAGSDGKLSINQSKCDGTSYEKIIDWQYNEPSLGVVDENNLLLAYSTEELSGQGDGLYLLDIKNKKLKTLTNNNKDFSVFFELSPSKKNIFFYQPIFENNKPGSALWLTDIEGKNKKGYLKTEDEIDYQNITWSADEKSIYLAGKPQASENFEKLYQYKIEDKNLSLIQENKDSNYQAVAINAEGSLIYYLLNSQLYAAKI